MDEEWDDGILSELSDSAFDFPPLEFEDDDDEEEGECSTDDDDDEETKNEINSDDILPSTVSQKAKQDVRTTPTNPIEILVDIDEDHKKIVTLKDGKDNLEWKLSKVISEDPALYDYVGAEVTFKVYSKKFDVWVDYDRSKELEDGMHVRAVFQTKHRIHPKEFCGRNKHDRSEERDYKDSLNEYVQRRNSSKYRHKKIKPYDKPVKKSSKHHNSEGIKETRNINNRSTQLKHCHLGIKSQQFDEEDTEDEDESETEGKIPVIITTDTSQDIENLPTFSEGDIYRMTLGLTGKNPISALHELCRSHHWDPPKFELLRHCTVGSVNHFWMQVTVNGETYSPAIAERKKKVAKSSAAQHCLMKLGIVK